MANNKIKIENTKRPSSKYRLKQLKSQKGSLYNDSDLAESIYTKKSKKRKRKKSTNSN